MKKQATHLSFLTTKEKWIEAYPIMKQLRTSLDLQAYLELVEEATIKEKYQLVALYVDGSIVALCGFMPMITLYNGRFIWICDLVTSSLDRSNGFGATILKYVQEWAIKNDYSTISLSSGLQRIDAHRFYEEKMEYSKVSYVYLKKL